MIRNVKIGWKQTVIDSDAAADAALAEHFANHHALLLRDALDPEFLDKLAEILTQAQFANDPVAKLGERGVEFPGFAGHLLRTALTRPPLLSWFEKITGCGEINLIVGKVTRYSVQSNDHLDWHNDAGKRRRLAITVNLGSHPSEGGEFEMRPRNSSELILRHRHSEPGMILVFRVTRDVLHRVLPVTGGGPRTVFSGWFVNRAEAVSEDDANP